MNRENRINASFRFAAAGAAGLLFVFLNGAVRADETWVYAVQIAATVQAEPPQIKLTWPQDPDGAVSYTVFRKGKNDSDWGTGTTLDGAITNYTDSNVAMGSTYEYAIVKESVIGYTGYGYIYSGLRAPMIEDRGRLILMVADNAAADLATELTQFEFDLIGDGWQVTRHTVSTNDSPDYVKSFIVNDFSAEKNVQAVLLFGHLPIFHSGNLNYDGHEARPMPADAFYGDVDDDWSGSPDFLPSDVELMVGRVDFADMPGNGSDHPWPDEIELLRNYLRKDHAWRHARINVPTRALMDDRRGVDDGWAPAASAYRNFDPLLGHDRVDFADWSDLGPPDQRWISLLGNQSYLWAYACGGGEPSGLSHAGTHGPYFTAESTDVVDLDAKAVFVMVFGSWFGNWDSTDNFMRSFLATPTMGLASCMSGEPHWNFHHMALGETIGYSTRVTMNNSTLYRSATNDFTRAVYIALMGDPTLRMYPVAPPSHLTAADDNGVRLNWAPSPDDLLGYYVYRSSSPGGPFTRVTDELVTGTEFTDTSTVPGDYTYMVRAVKEQTTASGTFLNPSQGVFATVTATNTPDAPLLLQASACDSGLLLSWNTRPGEIYRVMATDDLRNPNWTDISGPWFAWGEMLWFTDADLSSPQKFYRIVSP